MSLMSESGSTFSKTVGILVIVGILAIYGIYASQKAINDIHADDILNGVWEYARQEKNRIDPDAPEEEKDKTYIPSEALKRRGYGLTTMPDSTPTLIKVETEKKSISPGVCRALKRKFLESLWWGLFSKVSVIDRMGDEKTDVLIYDCPHEKIPSLRFYIIFAESKPQETEAETSDEEKTESAPALPPVTAPMPAQTPSPAPRPVSSSSSTYKSSSCPAGTSVNGRGGPASSGCRCNGSGEFWNGRVCETGTCPAGSSKSALGDKTNVPGCRCNPETPVWSGNRCISKCLGDKVLAPNGECICPDGKMTKKDAPNVCVECNEDADCFGEYSCVDNRCTTDLGDDCRWGICQTCDENSVRRNILEDQACETAGLQGRCNRNGTCYPSGGRRCSSARGCPSGEFCNYGGTLNSSKRQQGTFGQTPNVCQKIDAQKFTYKKVVYYYNTEKDLKSWCRAANNKANCKWGYLAKPGAESWCASLGKRLLTKAEMADVWDVLKEELPPTYTGYAYWVKEGAWMVDTKGRRSFGSGHPDGYGGKGGVVCR